MEIKVGDRFTTNKGGDVVVVEYVQADKIIVEFTDSNKHRVVTTKTVLLKGDIKNPFSPLLFGVGYMGVGRHKAKDGASRLGFKRIQSYSAWANMLSRCYDNNYTHPHLYKSTTVHDDWHCFQTYAEWYTEELYKTNLDGSVHVDKDILGNGSIYSPQTCSLVPAVINTLLAYKGGGKFLPGVRRSSNGLYRVMPGYDCSTIRFTSEKDAHLAFVQSKSQRIKDVANDYKDRLVENVYDTLMSKDFRYKFSPLFEPEAIMA